MNTTLSTTEREPLGVRAAVTFFVTAALHLAIALGAPISDEVETGVLAFVDAAGVLALVLWARRAVVPAAKVVTRVTTDGEVVAGDAATAPTGTALPVTRVSSGVVAVTETGVRAELVDPVATTGRSTF